METPKWWKYENYVLEQRIFIASDSFYFGDTPLSIGSNTILMDFHPSQVRVSNGGYHSFRHLRAALSGRSRAYRHLRLSLALDL